jgi:hypothetical protein
VVHWAQYSHTDRNIAHSVVFRGAVCAIFGFEWSNGYIAHSAVLRREVGTPFGY